MSDCFKALSDPTRRMILKLLKEQDLTAGEIAKHFDMSKPAISKHLELLYHADLVDRKKEGQYVRYSINVSTLQSILGGFLDFFDAYGVEKELEHDKK